MSKFEQRKYRGTDRDKVIAMKRSPQRKPDTEGILIITMIMVIIMMTIIIIIIMLMIMIIMMIIIMTLTSTFLDYLRSLR